MDNQLIQIAKSMVASGCGILAADESDSTIKNRFEQINVEPTEQKRRDYREMLFRSSEAMNKYISGVILFDETIRQSARDGTPLVEIIKATNSVPGIKVDKGAKKLAGKESETVTEGLDGLRERLQEYYELGARFAKWRAVINISDSTPTKYCINANSHALARYASLCQEAGIVPIVEPEVQMDGPNSDHDIDKCYSVTKDVLNNVFAELALADVLLEGIILKPNMVTAGKNCPKQASPQQVAKMTVECFKETIPATVPGIAFLSGGQSSLQATEHLSLMNSIDKNLPWKLTFSYGRALQQSAIQTWKGKDENWETAQAAFTHRARMNGLASTGEWSSTLEDGN